MALLKLLLESISSSSRVGYIPDKAWIKSP